MRLLSCERVFGSGGGDLPEQQTGYLAQNAAEATESGHRHVLQARLKKAGAAWQRETADQIAHLRILGANHKWASFWN